MKPNPIDHIGISTRAFAADYEALAALARKDGFEVFELALEGFGAGSLWPRTCGSDERKRVRQLLEPFSCVTVRAVHEGLNIANINSGQRAESIRQYIECMDFARDIGAKLISFRPGTQTYGVIGDPQEVVQKNQEFAKLASERAAAHDLVPAFETTGISCADMEAILSSLDGKVFSVDLNIGAIATAEDRSVSADNMTDTFRRWITAFADRTAVVHVSGVHQRWHTSRLSGCPISMNNVVDYGHVLRELARTHCKTPLVLDIKGADAPSTVNFCKAARDELSALARGLK